jgi:hypothetical protein
MTSDNRQIRKSGVGLNLFCKVGHVYHLEVGSTKPTLALVLVTILLSSGTSECESDSLKVVQASEILAAIERVEPVEYDDVIVEGDLVGGS